MKNHHKENRIFGHSLLIFYCYLLIIVNELRVNSLNFSKLKNEKNENIVTSMVSIGKGQKSGFEILKSAKIWRFEHFRLISYVIPIECVTAINNSQIFKRKCKRQGKGLKKRRASLKKEGSSHPNQPKDSLYQSMIINFNRTIKYFIQYSDSRHQSYGKF